MPDGGPRSDDPRMGPPATQPDPLTLLRSRSYLVLLAFAAILGVPVSVVAYWFLKLSTLLQGWVFTDLPKALGFHGMPVWWPLPPLAVAGVLVALTIRYLPGHGGESPAEGFKARPAPAAAALPGITIAALLTIGLGAVLGPEAPLIAIGGGVAALGARLARPNAPASATTLVGAAGSFAAVSTLLGSPILGAFLLMEASGLGAGMLSPVLVPGLLAAGVGSLIFIGLDAWTGFGTFSLVLPGLPHFTRPDLVEFCWAIAIGVMAALLGSGIRWLGLALRDRVERRILLLAPVAGLVVAGLTIAYVEGTGKPASDVLFSGQNQLGPLLSASAGYSAAALVLLLACKGLAYGVSLSAFRGGPTFPAMFLGAAGGLALSHLPGLPVVAGVAMGIGAMTVVMLRLPLTSVLLATVLLFSAGLAVMPLVIVAVVVAYVASARLVPPALQQPRTRTAEAARAEPARAP
jgi:H+/Cl- antiporter ClcA